MVMVTGLVVPLKLPSQLTNIHSGLAVAVMLAVLPSSYTLFADVAVPPSAGEVVRVRVYCGVELFDPQLLNIIKMEMVATRR
jgi:hypothetical protein